MERIFTLDSIEDVAAQFAQKFVRPNVFAFYGEMGSGKTTFIHAICNVMQVKGTVSSPTYAIINEYEYQDSSIFHIDLYRLRDEEEALQAGVQDCLFSGKICFVEWPQKAPGIFPEDTVKVFLNSVDEETRSIRIVDN